MPVPVGSRFVRDAHALTALCLAALGGGCQYQTIREAQLAHRAAEPRLAQAELASLASSGLKGPHEILGWLELGSADHALGRFDASSRALLRAEAGFDEQDARPRTSLTEELFASATSPLSVAYRGSPTDRIMAPTLRAMNAMMLGDDEQARLAFNEAAFRQEASVVDRISSIDIARQANGVDLARSVEAGMSDPAVEAVLASVRAFEPYRGFTNPFAEMLHAVYRLAAPRDDADRERGVALLRSVVGTTDNAHARDLLIETQEPSGDRAPSVHIFFASGFCPIREEIRIDLPLVLLNDTIDYVGLAFPRLAFDDRAVPYLDAETPDASVRTETLADMDRLMAVEYREEFPTLLTRAILAAGAKIAASYGINEATRDDETLNAAARIAAGLYLYSQNRADTRGWATLPKTYSYARLPAPRDGEILLGTPDGHSAFVEVASDADSLVFVRSMRPGVGFQVRVAALGERGEEEMPRSGIGTGPEVFSPEFSSTEEASRARKEVGGAG